MIKRISSLIIFLFLAFSAVGCSAFFPKTETGTATSQASETVTGDGMSTDADPEPDSGNDSETDSQNDPETETGGWGQKEYAPDTWVNTVVDVSRTEYTYGELTEDLALLAERYPSYFTYQSIGTSADGRSIWSATLGNPSAERQLIVTAGIHAREYVTCLLVMAQAEFYLDNYTVGTYDGTPFSDLFSACAVVMVPMVNPDGVTLAEEGIDSVRDPDVKNTLLDVYRSDEKWGLTASSTSMNGYFRTWKANLAGVDLNRNFPTADWEGYHKMYLPSMQNFKGYTPGSEPETRALMQLTASLSAPVASVCVHSQGEVVYWNCGQTGTLREDSAALAQLACDMTGYRYIAEENHDASYSDYCVLNCGIPAVTVEIGNGKGSSLIPASQIPEILLKNRFLWTVSVSYLCVGRSSGDVP